MAIADATSLALLHAPARRSDREPHRRRDGVAQARGPRASAHCWRRRSWACSGSGRRLILAGVPLPLTIVSSLATAAARPTDAAAGARAGRSRCCTGSGGSCAASTWRRSRTSRPARGDGRGAGRDARSSATGEPGDDFYVIAEGRGRGAAAGIQGRAPDRRRRVRRARAVQVDDAGGHGAGADPADAVRGRSDQLPVRRHRSDTGGGWRDRDRPAARSPPIARRARCQRCSRTCRCWACSMTARLERLVDAATIEEWKPGRC